MKADKVQVAGYGLHYHANNQLIQNVSDRMLLQCLIDLVRKQLAKSLDDQTVITPLSKLARMSGLDAYRTVPTCLERLEGIGLIRRHKNAITVMCDEYVTIVKHYESLSADDKNKFAKDFNRKGAAILQECRIPTILQGREELLGMSGGSITTYAPATLQKTCNNVGFLQTEVENPTFLQGATLQDPCKNVGFQACDIQNPTVLQGTCDKTCKTVGFAGLEVENPTVLQGRVYEKTCNNVGFLGSHVENPTVLQVLGDLDFPTFLQENLEALAKILHSCRVICDFSEFCEDLDPTFLQGDSLEFLKSAFLTGNLPESFKQDPKKSYIFAGCNPTFLQVLGSKILHFCRTVIIEDEFKKMNGAKPQKNEVQTEIEEVDCEEEIKKGLKNFLRVEPIELVGPSANSQEVEIGTSHEEQVLARAEQKMRSRNPYKNKPYIPVEKIKDIVEVLDEVVKSPVDFFIYQFWWGIYDLYCDHYQPAVRIDEQGDPIEDPQSYDWKEMINAPLPQDEIYNLAKNVYDDLVGAVEQGKYVYGDNNEWEVKFAFDSFQDFNPFTIFQWSPCTMQDKSIPALRVEIGKFYDIEADDVHVPNRGNKQLQISQNRKLVDLLLSADISQLTPMEKAIRNFYDTFVKLTDGNMIDSFTDAKGVELACGGLPDHILKPWCYGQPSVTYTDFTGAFQSKYKPMCGVHRGAAIFSADLVVRWNELHGFKDTVSHKALQEG